MNVFCFSCKCTNLFRNNIINREINTKYCQNLKLLLFFLLINLHISTKTTNFAPAKRKDRDLAQLVAHTSGGREVAGSSPVIPTKRVQITLMWFGFFLCLTRWVCLKDSYPCHRCFLVFLFPDAQNMRFSFVIHRFILIFAVE